MGFQIWDLHRENNSGYQGSCSSLTRHQEKPLALTICCRHCIALGAVERVECAAPAAGAGGAAQHPWAVLRNANLCSNRSAERTAPEMLWKVGLFCIS